jgi:hypothetical protein
MLIISNEWDEKAKPSPYAVIAKEEQPKQSMPIELVVVDLSFVIAFPIIVIISD